MLKKEDFITFIHTISFIRVFQVFSIGLFLMTGCGSKEKVLDNTVIAEYGDEILYKYELDRRVPTYLSGKDSMEYVEMYINDWLSMNAIKEKAENEIPNLEKEIEADVKNTRMTLIKTKYEDWLIKQQLDTVISVQEMRDYYKKYPDKFSANTTLYQYFYVETTQSNPSQVVSLMNSGTPDDLNKLIKWCEDNATAYRLDSTATNESQLNEIAGGFPGGNLMKAKPGIIQNYKYTDENKKTYSRFFKLLRIVEKGQTIPFAANKDKISIYILTQRKNDLIEQTEDALMKEAISTNKFKKHVE